MKHRPFIALGFVGVLSFVSGGWFLQGNDGQGGEEYQKARLFQRVLQFVAEYYVDSLDASQLYDMAIDGMLDNLDDPYTSFLRREAFGDLSISTTGNYGGVGLRIDLRDGWVTVVNPIADSPGQRAGIESGDQLIEIEGVTTKGWNTRQAADVLRGEPGTETNITVSRAGFEEPLQFTLTRARIHVNSVEGAMMLRPEIGYLRLTTVSENSASELFTAINDLRSDGATGIILDLRGNPGGVLNQGVALADLFLEPNDVVVETKGRAPNATETYRATAPEAWPDMPLAVLVNGSTASSAEIFAGALQDHDRAVIVGTPTFGKGVAYLLIPLTETEAVTVTSSRWYTPSGRSIQRPRVDDVGQLIASSVTPDVPDTSQIFVTDGGRQLKAGSGGIQPDVILLGDTLSDAEKGFADALGNQIPTYRNVVSRYALDLKGENAVSRPDFRVTTEMLSELYVRLTAAGIEMPRAEFDGAEMLISDQLGNELTRFAFGREAEIRRIVLDDVQAAEAVRRLEQAETAQELVRGASN